MTKTAAARAERQTLGHPERILVVDFGGQYTQLIARRVREVGVYSEILPWDASPEQIAALAPQGIILSGGPESVGAEGSPQISDALLAAGAPVLGICYGMQALAAKLGGKVETAEHREYGYAEVDLKGSDPLLSNLGARLKVWMSHGDRVERLPTGFAAIGSSSNSPLAAMADVERKIYALQFHPEVTHTEHGLTIIRRFVLDICGCSPVWTAKNIVAEHLSQIRAKVGKDRVLLGLSGGVDSSVVAALLHEAIGDQLVCVFVDTGLLRLNEGDQVMAIFAKHLGANVIRVNAEKTFLAGLAGVADPEQKRKIIGRLFVEVFDAEAEKIRDVKWLAQGTIYPDVIESAGSKTGKAHLIKSHHNVGGLPERMNLKLLEPLRDLFKDEVRKIGTELGLPKELVGRHPFPGPGLGVRILGEVRRNTRTSCAAPTTSSFPSYARKGSTTP